MHIGTSWQIQLSHLCAAARSGLSKNSWTDRDPSGHTPVFPVNHALDGGACWCYLLNTMAPMGGSAKTAKSIEMPFRGLTHVPATIYYLGEHICVIWWICLNLWLYQLKGNSVYRSNTNSTYICNSTYPFIHCWRTSVILHFHLWKRPLRCSLSSKFDHLLCHVTVSRCCVCGLFIRWILSLERSSVRMFVQFRRHLRKSVWILTGCQEMRRKSLTG